VPGVSGLGGGREEPKESNHRAVLQAKLAPQATLLMLRERILLLDYHSLLSCALSQLLLSIVKMDSGRNRQFAQIELEIVG